MVKAKIAIAYYRYSPRPRRGKVESIETQQEYVRQYCQRAEISIASEFKDEALSGKDTKRPGLEECLATAARLKVPVVVYSLSRLSRTVLDCLNICNELQKTGSDLISVHENIDTTSPMGRCFFTILCALNQLEREQTSERTSEAMIRLQESGRSISSQPPYGYRIGAPDNDGHRPLIEDEAEQPILKMIYDLKKQGIGLRRTTTILKKEGFPSRGTKWTITKVKAIRKRFKPEPIPTP